ncbi:hypothetical protein [Peribacillus deserti]|uniref:Uncharacterized protein n=1 Tax=Peribacillus deserti TaxID=673318 RepID=A0A2N5M6C0_9BACI|nr:hypothetical protein [Peribacillus deserti]PLT29897.1 hypothetical protein CUU66_10185 [Peribacillus deserti]
MRTLRQINAVYEHIIQSNLNERIKEMKLASLMREMERDYHIPLVIYEDWKKENEQVMALYRKIAKRRGL